MDGLPRVTEVEDRKTAAAAAAKQIQAVREKADPEKPGEVNCACGAA